MSSREFNQHVSKAKHVAEKEPLLITDRGQGKFVLLNLDDYDKLRARVSAESILSQLIMPEASSVEFELHQRKQTTSRELDW